MGLWVGSNSSISSDADEQRAFTKRLRGQEREFRSDLQASKDLKLAKKNLAEARFENSPLGRKSFNDSRGQVGRQVGLAAGTGMKQQVNFSAEQEALRQMFGGGEKVWGVNNQPVRINNDLNPSRSNPYDETAGMFGFGNDGERSGLF